MDRIAAEVTKLCNEDKQYTAAHTHYWMCVTLVQQAEEHLALNRELLKAASEYVDSIRDRIERELREDKEYMAELTQTEEQRNGQ